jgi:SAM-dependent methyltransferase
MLAPRDRAVPINTEADPYREAYEEMDYYNAWAAREQLDVGRSDVYPLVKQAADAGEFLQPGWLDASYDFASQADAYRHVAPIEGTRALQIGGRGIHVVKFLLAGAREGWLVTPMLGEAMFARELAAAFDVQERFHCVVGIAEELPFRDATFDRVYSGGCIHHTITARAFPEIKRIMRRGGRFAAIEPWRAPLYGVGTKLLGKRERGVNCRPMEQTRVEPLFHAFESAEVRHHGTFTRYPLLALSKFGLKPAARTLQRIEALDDRLASIALALRKRGSSTALLATKN